VPRSADYRSAPIARLRVINQNGSMALGLPVGISRSLAATGIEFYTIEFTEDGILFKPVKVGTNEVEVYPTWMKGGNNGDG
jgi:hypothetical protein